MKIPLLLYFYFSCYNGKEVPSTAMRINEIQEFNINTMARKDCKLRPAKYFVRKQCRFNEEKESEYLFYAMQYEAYTPGSSQKPNFPTSGDVKIGRSVCTRGMLDYVFVEEIARDCGVGKVLSVLCMLDPQINSVSVRQYIPLMRTKANKVLTYLEGHGDKDIAAFLKRCISLIGLSNIAENKYSDQPYAAAFAYLSAAHLTVYQYLVVQRSRKVRQKEKCFDELLYYKVNDIRTDNLFSAKTGLIGNKDGTGYNARWYFCRRIS